jgi:hypothetical protein
MKKTNSIFLENYRMSILWREHEHEEVDRAVFDNDDSKQALCSCSMYKFFQVGGMRAQRRLLNILIDYWNSDVEDFMLVGQSLTITVEDIYFIIGLSRRGEVPNFQYRGGGQSINEFINEHCVIRYREEWLTSDNQTNNQLESLSHLIHFGLDRGIQLFTLGIVGTNALWG